MIADYDRLDALGLAALVAAGEVAPGDLVAAAEEAVRARNPGLQAVAHAFFERGRRRLDDGASSGPFRGVPFFVKDAGLEVAGTPLGWGSRLFAGHVCEGDDTLARRLEAAGMSIVARTRAPEFSLSFTTEPEASGPVRNPWAPGRSAGGSSGGAAAAVAAGMVPIAHATDGAGSIRVPAAHCGLFGFKPGRIRNPLGPRVAEGNAGMATPHAVSRSVRDSAALLDATAGPDIGDPYAAPPPARSFLAETLRDPAPLRIGLVTAPAIDVAVDAECLAAVRQAGALCAQLGHHVEPAAPDYDGETLKRAWRVIAGTGVASAVAPVAAAIGDAAMRARVEPVNAAWIEEGRRWTALDYLDAVATLHGTARALGRFFERFDVLLSPVTAEIAPPLGVLAGAGMTLDRFHDRFWQHAPFTAVFNAAGMPAMSVPLYWTAPFDGAPRGLPVGVQFGAGPGGDGLLLALAGQLERARPWAHRRPDLAAIGPP